jgi:hypothetical protein
MVDNLKGSNACHLGFPIIDFTWLPGLEYYQSLCLFIFAFFNRPGFGVYVPNPVFLTPYSSPSGYLPTNVGYSAKCGLFYCGLLTQRVSWAPSTVRRLSYGRGGGPSPNVSSSSEAACVPVKTYINANLQKLQVLKENKGKSGIYR